MPKISALNELLQLTTASYLPVVDNQETQRVTMQAILDYIETEIDDQYVRHTELETTISAYTPTESFHSYTASLADTLISASVVFGEHTVSVNSWTASTEVSASLFVSGYHSYTSSVSTSLTLIGEYTQAFDSLTESFVRWESASVAFYNYTASNDFTISAILYSSSFWTGSYSVTAAYALTAAYFAGILPNGDNIKHFQLTPDTTWSFNHDLDEQWPNVTVYTLNNDVIQPSRIHAEDANSMTVYFTNPETGIVSVNVGGATLYTTESISSSIALGLFTQSINNWTASAEASASAFLLAYNTYTASVSSSLSSIGLYTASNDFTISALITELNNLSLSSSLLATKFELFTQSYYIASASFDERITSASATASYEIDAIKLEISGSGNVFSNGLIVSGGIVQYQGGLASITPATVYTKMSNVYYDYPINYPATLDVDLLSGSVFNSFGTKTIPAEFFISSSAYYGKTINVVVKGTARAYEAPPMGTTRSIVTHIEIGGTPVTPIAVNEMLGVFPRPFEIEYDLVLSAGQLSSFGTLKAGTDNYTTMTLPLSNGATSIPATGLGGEMKLILGYQSSIDHLTGSYASIKILN